MRRRPRIGVALSTAVAVAGALGGCGPLDFSPTGGRIALGVTFLLMLAGIVLAVVSGKGAKERGGKGGTESPDGAGAGWIVLTFLAAIAAVIVGTCNTFTARPAPAATPDPLRPAPLRSSPASPSCAQAVDDADRAFAALGQAQDRARSAAVAIDRACRVEAAPSPPVSAPPPPLGRPLSP